MWEGFAGSGNARTCAGCSTLFNFTSQNRAASLSEYTASCIAHLLKLACRTGGCCINGGQQCLPGARSVDCECSKRGAMLKAGRPASAALRAVGQQQRFMAASPDRVTATLFPGDGIGPEICESVKQVRDHSQKIFLCSARSTSKQGHAGCVQSSICVFNPEHSKSAHGAAILGHLHRA